MIIYGKEINGVFTEAPRTIKYEKDGILIMAANPTEQQLTDAGYEKREVED